jgi:hypothetical protein
LLLALAGNYLLIEHHRIRITEYEIYLLLLGAVMGSSITYYYLTRESRIIFEVRDDIDTLAMYVDLTPRQRAQADYPNAELVSDKRILELHDWSRRYKKSKGPWPKKNKRKIHPIRLTALIIICEELLGLSSADAFQANAKAKNLDDLRTLLRPKAFTDKQAANPRTAV